MPDMSIERMREWDRRYAESTVSISHFMRAVGFNPQDILLSEPEPPPEPSETPVPTAQPVTVPAPDEAATSSLYQTVRWALSQAFTTGVNYILHGSSTAEARYNFDSHLREWLGYQICTAFNAESQTIQRRNTYLRSVVESAFSVSPIFHEDLGHDGDNMWECPYCNVMTAVNPHWDNPSPRLQDIDHSDGCLLNALREHDREALPEPDHEALSQIIELRSKSERMASSILRVAPIQITRFGRNIGWKCPYCTESVTHTHNHPPATVRDMAAHDSDCIVHLALTQG